MCTAVLQSFASKNAFISLRLKSVLCASNQFDWSIKTLGKDHVYNIDGQHHNYHLLYFELFVYKSRPKFVAERIPLMVLMPDFDQVVNGDRIAHRWWR